MNNIYSLKDDVEDLAEDFIKHKMTKIKVSRETLDLDHRSASYVYINDDCIAVDSNQRRTLDYYGGFEYVDMNSVMVLGNYVFYLKSDERVQDVITFWKTGKDTYND